MKYELIIRSVLKNNVSNIQLISETSNKVYKVQMQDGDTLYAKFYQGNSTHIDNELHIYDLVDNKYLKEVIYKSSKPKMAIFKELVGKTVDELSIEELEVNSDLIISNICDYFNSLSIHKTEGYGLLDTNLKGQYESFYEFLKERQSNTSAILAEYKELSDIFDKIFDKYQTIIHPDNSLIPIDTNLKNIMVLNDGTIKFVDPGEMISGPLLMGYGDFVAHTYKTILYDKLITKLGLTDEQEKLLRIYAVFSSLNILAFLKKIGVNNLDEIVPYGNKYTFYELIKEHLKYLDIQI